MYKSRLLSHFLAVLAGILFLTSLVLAEEASKDASKDAANTEKEKEKPFKNAEFADTYMAKDEAFVTPKTHPYLFSFTGRWLRRREVFQASTWPGTSVTALIFGQTCRVKIQAPVKTGIVEGHYFLASIDNGPQLVLTLPTYNATENPVFELNIELPELDASVEEGAKANHVLIPHIVELISEPGYPIHLVGIIMQNTLVQQGRDWLDKQNLIPTIEYVADKLPGSAILNQTSMYEVAHQLGLRQSYIVVDSGVCFSAECSRKRAGLADQYSYFSPFSGNPRPQDAKEPMPSRYVFHRDDPMMMTKEPEFVIVDVGENDLSKDVDGLEFMKNLQLFLGNLILNARPKAEIFVLIRNGRYVSETEDAIVSMRYSKLHAVKFGADTLEWHKSFYCSYIIPLGDDTYPYRELCGTAYEQLTGSSADAAQVAKVLFLVGLVVSVITQLYLRRKSIASYVGGAKGYGKLPQVEE